MSKILPSSFIARAARARPGPIASSTVVPVTGASNWRTEPSGRVMAGMDQNPLFLGLAGLDMAPDQSLGKPFIRATGVSGGFRDLPVQHRLIHIQRCFTH